MKPKSLLKTLAEKYPSNAKRTKNVRPLTAAALVIVVTLSTHRVEAQNLLTNGDFSANASSFQTFPCYVGGANPASIPSWTLTTTQMGINGNLTATNVFGPADAGGRGSYAFSQAGSFSQDFSTVAGHFYLLQFDAAQRNNGATTAGWLVNVGVSQVLDTGNLSNSNFNHFSKSFLSAATGSTTLQFVPNGYGGDAAADLANVTLIDASGVWKGGVSGNLGGPDTNFADGSLNFATAVSNSSTLSFNDVDIFGSPVGTSSLTTVAGGVSAGTLLFNNSSINYSLGSADATGVTGATTLVKQGTGNLTLSGSNTYSGTTTINAGVLQYDIPSAVGNTSKITVNNGGELYFTNTNNGFTFSTPIDLNGSGAGGGGALHTYAEGGQITFSGPVTLLGNSKIFAFAAGSTLNFTNIIGGTGNLTFFAQGAATTHLNSFVLSGANSYSGDTFIDDYASNAEVKLSGGDNRLPTTTVVHMGSGLWDPANISVLDLNGNNQTIAGLSNDGVISLAGDRRVVNTSGTPVALTLNTTSNQSFSGMIGGADANAVAGTNLALIKTGGATQTLSGSNSYTGATTVNQGILNYDTASAVGSTSKITVNNGGEILFSPGTTNSTISAPIELNGGGIDGGAIRTYVEQGQITFSGPITLLGNSQIMGYAAGSILNFTNTIGGTGNITFIANGAAPDHRDYFVLSGSDNYVGDTFIENSAASSEVKLSGGDNRLPTTTVVHIGSGALSPAAVSVLDLNGNNQILAGLSDSGVSSLSGGRRVVNTSGTLATLTLNTTADQSFSGAIGGADLAGNSGNNLALVKTGVGTQTLSGASSTYTGTTTISAGTLKLVGSNSPIAATSQSNYTPDGRLASHTIDGSGMTPSHPVTASSTSGNSPGNAMWLSDGTTQTWITFDLGSTQTVTGFHLWNYNEVNITSRGVQTADVYAGTSLLADGSSYASGGSAWGTLAQSFTFTQADGTAADAGADYTFGTPVTSRYLQIYVGSNFGGDAYTGLSEIRFYSNGGGIGPLPTTTAVSIAGGATLDLGGSNQQIASLSGVSGASVINSSTVLPSVLTISSASGSSAFSGVIGGGGGAMSLVKDGNSTLTLSGANTYTGATTVSAGTLALVGGSQASPITLGSSGSLGFTLGSPTTSASTFNLSVGSIAITGTPTLASYTLITSSTSITGTPTLSPAISGYALQNTGTSLNLVQVSGSPYSTWATANGLTGAPGSSTDPAKTADPDGDGHNNLYEFAFDGNPLSGITRGKVVSKIATIGTNKVLTLTLPVRTGATFTTDSGDLLSGLIDGIYYRIEAGTDLVNFADPVAEVTGADATAIQSGLPALSSGWTYRTFRVSGSVPALPKDFMRAKVSETP